MAKPVPMVNQTIDSPVRCQLPRPALVRFFGVAISLESVQLLGTYGRILHAWNGVWFNFEVSLDTR